MERQVEVRNPLINSPTHPITLTVSPTSSYLPLSHHSTIPHHLITPTTTTCTAANDGPQCAVSCPSSHFCCWYIPLVFGISSFFTPRKWVHWCQYSHCGCRFLKVFQIYLKRSGKIFITCSIHICLGFQGTWNTFSTYIHSFISWKETCKVGLQIETSNVVLYFKTLKLKILTY